MRDFLFGGVLLLFSIVALINSLGIRNPGYDSLGPAFLPRMALILVGGLSMVLVLRGLRQAREHGSEAGGPWLDALMGWAQTNFRALCVATLLAAYICAINFKLAGFEILSTLFLVATGTLLARRNPKTMALIATVSVVAAIAVGYVFKTVLRVYLP